VRDTAYSHDRVFVVEVMGRKHGFIALEAGLAGGAEAILIPEIPFSLNQVCEKLAAGTSRGKKSSIIVVAEGAGSAHQISQDIRERSGFECRELVLGHMQRGGNPTAFDRVLATRIGSFAATQLMNGRSGEMAGFMNGAIVGTPLETVLSTDQPIDSERLLLADVMAQ
jgi:6-phosphofructokinase 1